MRTSGSTRLKGALLIPLVVVAVVLAASGAVASTPGVEPVTVNQTADNGTSFTVTKTVHTPEIPPTPDIVFLADSTGSMFTPIANAVAGLPTIMSTVLGEQPSAEFAAAQYKDTPDFCADPFAFNLDQSLTANTTDVANAASLNWVAGGGCDDPEGQLNALTQLAGLGFRPDSTRIIVWFGDAPGHDPSNGATLASTIAALQGANVEVIAVPVEGAGFPGVSLDQTGQATAITGATNGVLLGSTSANDVADAILDGLTNLPVNVTANISCSTGLTLTLNPASQTVPSGDDATFTETVSVAANAPAGALQCTVEFLLNGQLVDGFTETVNVNRNPVCANVTGGPNLWPPNHKMKTITLTGATDPDGNALTFTVTGVTQDEPLNGLGDGDTSPDAMLLGGNQVQLRAERSGTGDGRVYRIAFTVSDGNGGSCTGVAVVGVPHDQGPKGGPVDSGLVVNSLF